MATIEQQTKFQKRFEKFRGATSYAAGAYSKTYAHTIGKDWVQQELGVGKYWKTTGMASALKWMGRGFVGFSAYQGYQEGGIIGAGMGVATHLGLTYAVGAAAGVIGATASGIGIAGGVGAAVAGAGFYAADFNPFRALARPFANEHMKKHARLEMGTAPVDNFGTVATMRQRSLQAINNSHLNGRVALGNEATLNYTPYFMR